ncbi:MAG: hypothetical protein HZC50_08925 [Nitrospirae bacterium]|nr:hypothetical protein [Nitrospirota bacterium]
MLKQLLRRRFIVPVAVLCVLSLPMAGAQAASISYSFTGSIDGISEALAPVSGTFQFNPGMAGSAGVYNNAVTGFTLNLGGIVGYSSTFEAGANAITISQNKPLGGGVVDRWALTSAATGGPLGDFTPFSFDLRVDHPGGGLFTTTDLQGPPSLNVLTTGRWRLFLEDSTGNPAVFLGSISSLTAVPLPPAVVLFGLGIISLVGLGAGGLRNLRGSRI